MGLTMKTKALTREAIKNAIESMGKKVYTKTPIIPSPTYEILPPPRQEGETIFSVVTFTEYIAIKGETGNLEWCKKEGPMGLTMKEGLIK